jgi:protein-glutamine gamma-glutamyltransferase
MIYGMPYSPGAKFLANVEARYGRHMKEFVENMYNHDKPPVYTFSTYQQLRFEIAVRHQAIKGMETVHAGCCGYPSKEKPPRLDETFWVRAGLTRFKPKAPLPAGKDAADAVEAIFAPGANTRLDCVAMTVAVEYYSLLKGLGRARFNALFPGGAGLEISNWIGIGRHPMFYGAKRLYKNVRLASKSEILPGDWVYFENFRDYLQKHWGGYWQGENAIYLGGGQFRGFGTGGTSEAGMNAKLVRAYNDGLAAAEQKTVTDLLAQGGGLQLAPVFRPDMSKLVP